MRHGVLFFARVDGCCDKKRCRTENPQRSINAKTFTRPVLRQFIFLQ
jgi:hypothetical protein